MLTAACAEQLIGYAARQVTNDTASFLVRCQHATSTNTLQKSVTSPSTLDVLEIEFYVTVAVTMHFLLLQHDMQQFATTDQGCLLNADIPARDQLSPFPSVIWLTAAAATVPVYYSKLSV